jgi:hypothetical protein
MKWSSHLAGFAVLIALGTVPAFGAASASVSGAVYDSAGIPQIGAVVELLRPDLSVVASVYTDSKGQFEIASVMPGRYALKAIASSFLPSLRENIRIRRGTIVNLTLNTLYEVMQWLPAQPGGGHAQQDDWAWTLRSAANRPLLRWLEDGPLVVVTDSPGATPKLKARLMATGQDGSFGESGQRFTASVEDTPDASRELLARVDFAPGSNADMESMLGFRQNLGFAGSVQSMATVAIHPEIGNFDGTGLDEAAIRSSENLQLSSSITVNAGSTEVLARLAGQSSSMIAQGLPFANVAWHAGSSTVSYRMATMVESWQFGGDIEGETVLPELSARNGELEMEHGLHQEIGWRRQTDSSALAVLVYTDNIKNPVLEAMGHFAQGGPGAGSMAAGMLFDPASGLLRAAGPSFSSTGIEASFERVFSGGDRIRLSYANGNALAMTALPQSASLTEVLEGAPSRHVQTYAISFSGTLDGTHTHWRATYRWQPDGTLTEVAPYALDASEPYLNVRVRQPICLAHNGSTGIEALVEVNNLLAEGYHPYFLSDGSVLLFAQDQRSFRGGLAFTF